jgi:hypothetical protein
MMVLEGRESDLAPSVWARGGQAPLRVQTYVLTGTFASQATRAALRPGWRGLGLRAPRLMPSPAEGFLSGSQVCPSAY